MDHGLDRRPLKDSWKSQVGVTGSIPLLLQFSLPLALVLLLCGLLFLLDEIDTKVMLEVWYCRLLDSWLQGTSSMSPCSI